MATTKKEYLDFKGLSAFKDKIVAYIDSENEAIVKTIGDLVNNMAEALSTSDIDAAIAAAK